MTDAQSALSAAIVSALNANAALTAIIGANAIHDRLLTKAAMPYVVLREITSSEWGADNDGGLEHQIALDAWSSRPGHREAETMAGLIRQSLDNAQLTLTGGVTLVSLLHVKTRTRREAKTDAHVAEMVFRAVTVGG
ncbi:DUF3168 domain-containing protein [Rhizobium sp. C4]|uniref:DUF3168 domain-containing protein n=1 Tax=Rhizobium sp. C4 TaxID=1349800 RepID=UPI001E60332C|nr:DUF3168 domain-containing protein [Rhizobium sp. C4]MCD2172028.1 DUF3168 domain-containing protein [Rhizobium sp. C4]